MEVTEHYRRVNYWAVIGALALSNLFRTRKLRLSSHINVDSWQFSELRSRPNGPIKLPLYLSPWTRWILPATSWKREISDIYKNIHRNISSSKLNLLSSVHWEILSQFLFFCTAATVPRFVKNWVFIQRLIQHVSWRNTREVPFKKISISEGNCFEGVLLGWTRRKCAVSFILWKMHDIDIRRWGNLEPLKVLQERVDSSHGSLTFVRKTHIKRWNLERLNGHDPLLPFQEIVRAFAIDWNVSFPPSFAIPRSRSLKGQLFFRRSKLHSVVCFESRHRSSVIRENLHCSRLFPLCPFSPCLLHVKRAIIYRRRSQGQRVFA